MLAKIKTRTSIIYSALLKHSYDNFTLDILEYCDIDVLTKREQYYMDLLNQNITSYLQLIVEQEVNIHLKQEP